MGSCIMVAARALSPGDVPLWVVFAVPAFAVVVIGGGITIIAGLKVWTER